jgi:hypothetical protein
MRFPPSAFCAALFAAICGCAAGAAGRPNEPKHDAPVPDSVPRAEVALVVDLEPAAACEESFDLALYKEHGVDLVRWDDRDGKCAGRHVVVRYLSNDIKLEQLLAKIEKLARRVEHERKEGKQ